MFCLENHFYQLSLNNHSSNHSSNHGSNLIVLFSFFYSTMSQSTITTNLTHEHKNQATTTTKSFYNIKYVATNNNKNKLFFRNGIILTSQDNLWKNVCETVNSLLDNKGYNQVEIETPIPFGYNDCCINPLFNGTFCINKKVSDLSEYEVSVCLFDFSEDQLNGITNMFNNKTLGMNIKNESMKSTPQFDIVKVNEKSKEHSKNHIVIKYTCNKGFYGLDVSFDVCKIFISLFWFITPKNITV